MKSSQHITQLATLAGILVFLFIFSPKLNGQQDTSVCDMSIHDSIKQLIQKVEERCEVKFYFQDDWINSVFSPDGIEKTDCFDLLAKIEKKMQVRAIYLNRTTIVLIPTDFNVPDFKMYTDESVRIGVPTIEVKGNQPVLTGKISDGSTGEPIFAANIFVNNTSTSAISDSSGSFAIEVPLGNSEIKFSCLGYLDQIKTVRVYSDGSMNVELFTKTYTIEDVSISATSGENLVNTLQMGMFTISKENIKKIPAFLGEADVIKSITMLPGVSTAGESMSGISVRGGNPDQNMFLIDGVPLFNLSHMFGFISSINPDIVNNVTFYKGNMPANYGGRLSSIIDIQLSDEILNTFKTNGNIGLFSVNLSSGFPLKKDKNTVYIAARKTYSDWMLAKTGVEELKQSQVGYYDVNLKYIQKFDKKNTLNSSFYATSDMFRFENQFEQGYATQFITLDYNRMISERCNSKIAAYYSKFKSTISEFYDHLNASTYQSGISTTSLNSTFKFFPSSNHKFITGFSTLFYTFKPGEIKPYSDSSQVISRMLVQQNAIESALFIGYDYQSIKGLSFSLGLRYNLFNSLEDGSTYSIFNPRLSFKYKLKSNVSFKGGWSNTNQFIHIITNTTNISPTDVWVLSDKTVRPQQGNQYSFGIFGGPGKRGFESSAEIYYKEINGLVDISPGSQLLMNEKLYTELNAGEGVAYGIEFMLKKSGKLNGWINYSFSNSMRRILTGRTANGLHFDDWYPADYDKPHDIKCFINYKFTEWVSIGINGQYSSGRPATFPIGYYVVQDLPVVEYSKKNQFRIPAYKRIDFSVKRDIYLKNYPNWKSGIVFSVYNIFGWDNTYSIFFRNELDFQLNAYEVLIVNRPVPSISYYFEF